MIIIRFTSHLNIVLSPHVMFKLVEFKLFWVGEQFSNDFCRFICGFYVDMSHLNIVLSPHLYRFAKFQHYWSNRGSSKLT